jgi:small-conductance mechanosensitive channel
MKIKLCSPLVLVFLLFYLFNSVLFAQDETGTGSEEQKVEQISAISASDIANKSEETNRFLQNSKSVLEIPANIVAIENKYADYIEQLDEVNIFSDSKKLEKLTVMELTDLSQKCLRYKSYLGEWITILTNQSARIETESQEIKRWIEIWQKTDESAKEQNLPRDVISTMRSVIQLLQKADKNIAAQLKKLLSTQNKISSQDIILSDIITKIESQKRENLLELDSEPLWNAIFDWEGQSTPAEQVQISIKRHTTSLSEFYDNYRRSIIYHIITFLLFLTLLILIRRYSDKWVFQTEAVKVLSRPFSQALLITLILNAFFYLQAPNVVIVLNRILIMIIILRLLPASFDKKFRSLIYGFTAIHILQQFHLLSTEQSLLQRLIILIISISALFIITRILYYNKHKIIDIDTKSFRFFISLMRITMVLLIISVLNNIVGNVSLAEQLNFGAMHSIYAALGLTIAVHIVAALFVTLLYSRYANFLLIVQKQKETIKNALIKILNIGSFLFWLTLVLNAYSIYKPVEGLVGAIFERRFTMGSINISLGDIVIIILTIWVSFWVSKLIRFFLEGDVLSRIKLPRGVPATISKLTHYIILVFGFVVALSMAGFDLSKFALIAGALSVGIGFGLQNMVNNFISGLILIFERPIQTGDVIELGELLGVVKRIGIRASMIRTFTGAEVIVPNGNLISNEVVNWTLSDKVRRIEIAVGVAYGTDPTKVLTLLKNLTLNHPEILEKPESMVLFQGFGDSSLDFEVRFWTGNSESWLELKSQITVNIHDALKRAKIEIPFPQRDLHIKSGEKLQMDNKSTITKTRVKKNLPKQTGTTGK